MKFIKPVLFSALQLQILLDLQHKCNQVLIAPDYLDNPPHNLDFALAANKEYYESFDHLNYKWWKAGKTNAPQFALEMVDCLHFSLSEVLKIFHERGMDIATGAADFHQHCVDEYLHTSDNIDSALVMAEADIASGELSFETFLMAITSMQQKTYVAGSCVTKTNIALILAQLAGFTDDKIFKIYVAKNTLNIFRATHGYKEGTYIKDWFGQEDNATIEAYLNNNDMSQPDAIEALNAHLEAVYATVVASQA